MAGRPKTRARREAQARAKKRFDRVAREAILKRAEEIGSAAAARESGVAPGTLRTWRKRMADAPEPASSLPGESMGENARPETPADRLRATADKAREASSRALDQADSLLARGLASEARNASVVSSVHAERAQELETSARAEEAHEVALSEAQGRLVLDLVGAVFADVALPRPDGLLRARLQGWPGEPDPEIVEQAREEIRRAILGEVRAEVLAEMEEARLARPALPAGSGEAEPEGEPEAAEVVEDAVVVDAEPEPERQMPPTKESRYGMFSHPMLGGGP